jgi:hypothetical protein
MSAEPIPPPPKICEFLDVSPKEEIATYFAFTCKHDIMVGSGGQMRPKDGVNRAEAAKITTLIMASLDAAKAVFAPFGSEEQSTTVAFDDITVGDWYAPPIYFLYREGVLAKKPSYRPADFLTRAEAMKLVVEAYATISEDVLTELEALGSRSIWYEPYQAVSRYVKASIGSLGPAGIAARQEIAELLYKLQQVYPTGKFK